MDETLFEKKLNELVSEIGSIPKHTKDSHKKLKKSISSLQESLDYLRVSIKYMLFDLEATRRENNYLRKLLEDKSK